MRRRRGSSAEMPQVKSVCHREPATRRQDAAPRRAMVGAVSLELSLLQPCDMRAMHRPAISGNQHEPAAGHAEGARQRRADGRLRACGCGYGCGCGCGAVRCVELRTAWSGRWASMKLWLRAPCYWHRARPRDDSGRLSAGLHRRLLRTQHVRLCTYNAAIYQREAQQRPLCTRHPASSPRTTRPPCRPGSPGSPGS
jgi:hypothetical protein